MQQHVRQRGDKAVLVDRRWRLTFAELERLAWRAACGLLRLGLQPSDVMSMQLPNWAEWLITHCAATKIGMVTNSIGAVYRHKEVQYILWWPQGPGTPGSYVSPGNTASPPHGSQNEKDPYYSEMLS